MSFLSTFLDLNRDIILFVYGLVFFVLGLAIALQSRSYSRLDLARSLKWLAAFGLAHGFHEWGDMFIPIQAAYLSPAAIQGLMLLHILLLALSFIYLVEFGATLLRPAVRLHWLRYLTLGLGLAWSAGAVGLWLWLRPDAAAWYGSANALARYLLAFPGSLLGAYGLYWQSTRLIRTMNIPHLARMLRLASLMLLLYAVFGGLIPPPAPFFPANLVNADSFRALVGFPPLIMRSLVGLVLSVAIIRVLDIFNIEVAQLIEEMEQQQILAGERERIGRELHDGAIQIVYTAGLLVESSYKLADPGSPIALRLEKAVIVLNDAIQSMRRSLVELRPSLHAESLPAALTELVQHPRYQSLVEVDLDCQAGECSGLSPVRVDHILSIVREALSNAVRHGHAQKVRISVRQAGNQMCMEISDNGLGLPLKPKAGYGLRNMHDRARLLGGRLELSRSSGPGTTLKLEIPWKEEL